MISVTRPEPLADIEAQLRALCDPAHQKTALWIARGTRHPKTIPANMLRADLYEGTLLTTDPRNIRVLKSHPSDDTLALILGYPEAKSELGNEPPAVIQACDDGGLVITEMACSAANFSNALSVLSRHGQCRVFNVPIALARRLEICTLEDRLYGRAW